MARRPHWGVFLLPFCVAEDTPHEEPIQAADDNEGQRFRHGPYVDGRKQDDQEDCDINQFCHGVPLLKCAQIGAFGVNQAASMLDARLGNACQPSRYRRVVAMMAAAHHVHSS